MDVKQIAAEKKAKALADLKEAEEMERDAEAIARLAAKRGWKVDIIVMSASEPVILVETKTRSAAAETHPILTGVVLPPKKSGGKPADPMSTTSRSKSESVKIVRTMKRPVPLGELLKHLAAVGVVLGGKNPNQALSANLGHTPELVSTKRGWWLAGVPVPPESSPKIGGGHSADIFGGRM